MAISDEYRIQVWKDVLQLCKLRPDEGVIVLTGESSHPANIDNAMRAALALGSSPFRLDLPPVPPWRPGAGDRTAFLGRTPLTGNPWALAALEQATLIIDLMGLLHSPEQAHLLGKGVRMLMVVEPPEVLSQLVPTAEDKARVMAADALLSRASRLHVTSRAGTDLHLEVGQFATLPEYGYADEPGHWDHWPSGFLSTWPNEGSAHGRVVIDVGDMLFPFKRYVESAPITLQIERGMITNIEGGFEAKLLRMHIDSYRDPKAYAVSHVGWGLQRNARWTALAMRDKLQSLGMDARAHHGNFLFSTGPNSEAGGSNDSACHVDIPMAGCSVAVDGELVVAHGELVQAAR